MTHVPSQWPSTIREINDLPRDVKEAIYRTLIPGWIFPMFGIDPVSLTLDGRDAVRFRCPEGSTAVEVTVLGMPNPEDPALYLQMGDTFNSQLLVQLAVVNDPTSPRFDIDVDEYGRDTQLGTAGRNIPAEIQAMLAGLAPGQTHRGLRVFRTAVPMFEAFVQKMGHDLFFAEPLFYHNAIMLERYGFAYARGLRRMMLLHDDFQPGGTLHARLDDSTPFRASDAWQSVLGRSWTIHDGLLDKPFTGIQMYKRVGHHANVCTFPNAIWRFR